jgi:glutathione S-transferase
MKLIYSPNSPFARKCRVLLLEKSIPCEMEMQMPFAADTKVAHYNPLGKVPALVTDDGRTWFDSRVICEYLDGAHPKPRYLPDNFDERISVKRWEALADGVCDAVATLVYENRRADASKRSAEWIARQQTKAEAGLAELARELGDRDTCTPSGYNLADVAVGCTVLFLDLVGKFPMPDFQVRTRHPNLAALGARLMRREAWQATVPPG